MRLDKALFIAVALPIFWGVAGAEQGRLLSNAEREAIAEHDELGAVEQEPEYAAKPGRAVLASRGEPDGAEKATQDMKVYGVSSCLADFDDNGRVDFPDFVAFAGVFGATCVNPPVSIPDRNLRAVIADSLGKAPDAPITRTDMAKLTELGASNRNIRDLTGLEFATNLRELNLSFNKLTGPIPPELTNLTNLELLRLDDNADLSDEFDILASLRGAGIVASFYPIPIRESDFDIELVFLDAFTDKEKRILNYLAKRWTWLITRDVADYEFTNGWSAKCGDQFYEISAGERIDDLRIYVTTTNEKAGWGGPHALREETFLSVVGCMAINIHGFRNGSVNLHITGLHEIAHVLGFGSIWSSLGFLQDREGEAHFNGPLAIDAFNDAGGDTTWARRCL